MAEKPKSWWTDTLAGRATSIVFMIAVIAAAFALGRLSAEIPTIH